MTNTLTGNAQTTTYSYGQGTTTKADPSGRQMTYSYGSDGIVTSAAATPQPSDYQDCLEADSDGVSSET